MSRICDLSLKGPLSGNTRSHAMNHSRRRWNVNLQTLRLKTDNGTIKLKVSARMLKTLKKNMVL